MINKSNIGELTIEEKGFKVSIKQKQDVSQQVVAAQAPVFAQAPGQTVPSLPAAASSVEKPKLGGDSGPSTLIMIKSPMIGTFYRSPSPEVPSFVNVGDEVTPGKVVCIIEAMKLFNEIESEIKGKIVKVLIDDASPVEYDQPLFLVDPV